jgi:hypothetical protein
VALPRAASGGACGADARIDDVDVGSASYWRSIREDRECELLASLRALKPNQSSELRATGCSRAIELQRSGRRPGFERPAPFRS